jgi:hypothetical protein
VYGERVVEISRVTTCESSQLRRHSLTVIGEVYISTGGGQFLGGKRCCYQLLAVSQKEGGAAKYDRLTGVLEGEGFRAVAQRARHNSLATSDKGFARSRNLSATSHDTCLTTAMQHLCTISAIMYWPQ